MNRPSNKKVTSDDLRESIHSLEEHCRHTEWQINESFKGFKESLKPINVLKRLVHFVLPSSRKTQIPKLVNQQPGQSIRQLLLHKAGIKKVLFLKSK
jgi:hypothetical protein